MTTVYLGYPPENIKAWILAHSASVDEPTLPKDPSEGGFFTLSGYGATIKLPVTSTSDYGTTWEGTEGNIGGQVEFIRDPVGQDTGRWQVRFCYDLEFPEATQDSELMNGNIKNAPSGQVGMGTNISWSAE